MVILGSRLIACAPEARPFRANGFDSSPKVAPRPIEDVPSPATAGPKFDEIEVLGRRCKNGDVAAWSLLFPKIWPVLVTFVHRLYHSFGQQDAEDVAQASIKAAIEAIDSFSGQGLFRAWLFGIAVRQAATFHRCQSAKKRGAHLLVSLDNCEDHEDGGKSPADFSAENDRAAILHRAISRLSESDRDLVHLHFFGELTFREIAEARNMNAKTVCTRLTRCKEKLLASLSHFDLTNADG